jgi:hypothetical protein
MVPVRAIFLIIVVLALGGCSFGPWPSLPDAVTLPDKTLSGVDQQDTIKAMNEAAQAHSVAAAQRIEKTK